MQPTEKSKRRRSGDALCSGVGVAEGTVGVEVVGEVVHVELEFHAAPECPRGVPDDGIEGLQPFSPTKLRANEVGLVKVC